MRFRFILQLTCSLLILDGCDGRGESPSAEDVASDGPLAGSNGDTAELTPDSKAPDAGPDEEPPVWAEYVYLKASNVGPTHMKLVWGHEEEHGTPPATDAVGVTTFAIHQDGVVVGEVEIDDPWSFYPDGIQPDTVYLFQIQAGDAAGNWSSDGPSKEVKTECATYWEDKCPVSWPADATLVAEPTSDTSVLLSWTPAYDNQEVRWYRVLKDGECLCQDFGVPESNYTVEGDVTEYEVTGLQPGVIYQFQISARDSVGIEHGGGGWILGPEAEVSL